MDTTAQNSSSQPANAASVGQVPVSQNIPVPPQPISVNPPVAPVPQPPQEVVSPPSTPKITLDDLYGPSGLADVSNVPQPSVPTPAPTDISAVPDLPPVAADVPLRKHAAEMAEATPPEPPKDIPPVSSSPPPEDTPKEKLHAVNKLLLLRILFGAIGAVVLLIIILFLVMWLSSVFHPAKAQKVTLSYWGLWEDSNTMQSAISQFEQQHPNITVTYEKQDPKQYSQRLLTRMQQGNGPDIFTYHSSWLPMVQAILLPLPTSVISKNELQNNFYPVVQTDLVKNGALYGIPLEVDTLSLFVNNTLLQSAKAQVPTTWDTFTQTARALTQKDAAGKIKIAGAALGTYDNVTHAPDILSALFAQNNVTIATLSPKSNVSDALNFYTSFATGDSNVWDSTLDPSQLAFAKGNLAMYFGYSWDIFILKAANPTLNFSVYPIPHLPGTTSTAASYWVEGISQKSTNQKEALLFMQFLAQKNTAATLYAEEAKTRLFGEPYARSDLGQTLKDNPLVYPFVEQATDARSSFFAGETQDSGLNGQMNGYLGNAVRSILNTTSADSAVDTLLHGVTQVENQYGSQ